MVKIPLGFHNIEFGSGGFVDFIAELLNAPDEDGFEVGVVRSDEFPIPLVAMRMCGAPRFVVMSANRARDAAQFLRGHPPEYAPDKERLTQLAEHLEAFADHADAITSRARGTLH